MASKPVETQRKIIQILSHDDDIFGLSEDGNLFLLEEDGRLPVTHWEHVIESPYLEEE